MDNDTEKGIIGRDEMNIAEFPITALTRKPNFKPVTCENEIEIKGQKIKRKWILSGDLRFGTPIATDEDTVMAIQKYLSDLRYTTDTVKYKTYEFLKLVKWRIGADSYLRHDLSLLRLFGSSISAEYAFYDNKRKCLVPVLEGFHIVNAFKIYGKERGIAGLDLHIWKNRLSRNEYSGS